MNYAVKNDGAGWRAINSPDEIMTDEAYSSAQPFNATQIQPDINGFIQTIKIGLGGIMAVNSLAIVYPLFFAAVQSGEWDDVRDLVIDAKTKSVITTAQYNAIKSAAEAANIPNAVNW